MNERIEITERMNEIIQRHLEKMFTPSLDEAMEAEEDKAHTTFFHDEIGPWVGVYQINACFRDVFTSLGYSVKKRGSLQTFQHLLNPRLAIYNLTNNIFHDYCSIFHKKYCC